MRKKVFTLLTIGISLMLYSCDAYLSMPYDIKNETGEIIKLNVKYFPIGRYEYVEDTIIELIPNSNLTIGYGEAIGFPWETKKIFKKNPGVENFELLIEDSINHINKSDENWKYMDGKSIYKIQKKHLLQK